MSVNYLCFKMSVVAVFVANAVFAKGPADVSATVKDSRTKEAIEFATVELLSGKDSVLTGCITDSKGYFEIASPVRAQKIRIRFLGYQSIEMGIKDKDLGVLLMNEDSKQLNEVSVKGSAKVNKIDRDVVFVSKEMRAGTVTSQELLGKLNGVSYNRYDKSISVNGSTNVLLLVDGVEKDQQMAKTLPPERIERIEVIKDPIGKYATDGYAAVINIILRKDYSGLDFSIGNTSFFDVAGSSGSQVFIQDYGNLNLSYTFKKLNVYITGRGYGNNMSLPTESVKRYGNISTVSQPFDLDNPNGRMKDSNGNASVGADYQLSKNHTVSAEVNWNGDHQNERFVNQLTNSMNGTMLSSSNSESFSFGYNDNLRTTLTYNGKLDDKSTITSDLRYNYGTGKSDNLFVQDAFTSLSRVDKTSSFLRFNASFTYQFAPKFSTEIGYGFRRQSNTSEQQNSSFEYKEFKNRVSLYANYQPATKWKMKVGGILETYHQNYQGETRNVSAFLPYFNLQYVVSRNFNVVAKYHTFADYPSMDQLTPFKTATDSLTWNVGNPNLKTSVYKKLGVEFNIMNFITVEPYYNFDNQHMASYVAKVGRYYYVSDVNADLYERYGVRLNFTLPLSKSLFWQNNLDFYKNHIEYKEEGTTVRNSLINSTLVYVNQKKGLTTGVVLQKRLSKEAGIQGYSNDNNDLIVLLVGKSFMKERLNLTLLYMPPVNMGMKYQQDQVVQAADYYQRSSVSLNLIKNMVLFELNYHLTSGKQVKTRQAVPDSEATSKKSGGFGL